MLRARLTTKRRLAQAGFSVVEVLLAATLLGMLATGVVGAVVYGRASTADAGDTARANYLAEEGIEAARNIADAAFTNLVDGTYGITQNGTQFAFSGTSDITDIYTRQVIITTAGTNRKTVTSTVTWTADGGGSVTHTARLTNWAASLKLWSNLTTQTASIDATGTADGLKVATAGNYAYIVRNVATTANFIIVNISNPASPTIVSTNNVANTPTNIAVSGNYAYITNATNTTGLQIYDVSTPATPTLAKTLSFTAAVACRGVFVSGNVAYVVRASSATVGANEFNVISSANVPASAAIAGGYNNDIQMNEVWASGNYAYVATSSTTQEMLVINVITPTAPALAATYNPATALAATTITGFGNTVLLGMSTTLDAINVITPTAPARISTFTAGGTINDIDVDVANQFAFLGTSNIAGEFQAVNITNTAAMANAKIVDVGGATTLVTVNGVAYNNTYDAAVGVSAGDTQEGLTYIRN
jgi:hypothetical protein